MTKDDLAKLEELQQKWLELEQHYSMIKGNKLDKETREAVEKMEFTPEDYKAIFKNFGYLNCAKPEQWAKYNLAARIHYIEKNKHPDKHIEKEEHPYPCCRSTTCSCGFGSASDSSD